MEDAKVAAGIRRLTVNIDEDDVNLFEGLWPVPNGVALHAYLVEGKDRVLVDPWDAGGYGVEEIAADLEEWGLAWKDIRAVAFTKAPAADYLARLRAVHPTVEAWGLPGDSHDLGGLKLEPVDGFWKAGSVVFTGDALAGLGWVEETVWAEDLGEHEARYFDDEALRWFASRPLVPSLPSGLTAAPAHGCLWRSASAAVERAARFEAWGGAGLDEVAVVWPAGAGADALVEGVLDAGAGLNLLLPGDPLSTLKAAARRSALVVIPEGADASLLEGLEKEVWRPALNTPPDELRAGVSRLWKEQE